MMRGSPGMRLTMAILSPLFLLLCVVAIHSEETRPWMAYQEEYARLYRERVEAELAAARDEEDERASARWQRVAQELAGFVPSIEQIHIPELGVTDRCVSCHRGISNPLLADAAEPFRSHPGTILQTHDPNVFGCTSCHHGQGAATTVEGGHGHEENWDRPLLPAELVQTTCPQCHEVTHGLEGAERVTRGADLFLEKGCYGCHEVSGLRYLPKFSPPLDALEHKLAEPARWLYAWIRDPQHVSPTTAMPAFDLGDEEAAKITRFLLSRESASDAPPTVSLHAASAEEGERLFRERGCVGCHAVDSEETGVSPRVPHLAGIGSKVTPEWLDAWIADPKRYNPDAAMPKVPLSEEERHHVVAYLLTLKRSEPVPGAPELETLSAEEGRELVQRYECFGCHSIDGFEEARPAVPDLAEFARKPVVDLDFATVEDVPRTKHDWLRRKLREPQAFETEQIDLFMPTHRLTDEEVDTLVAYVLAFDHPERPEDYRQPASGAAQARREVAWMTAHLNCNACHPLDEREPRIADFVERKSRIPPTLDGVGERLQGQYLYEFLLEPARVRPWLDMQMPVFAFPEADAQALVDGFAARAEVSNPYTHVAKPANDDERFERGARRFLHYKCMQCHPTSLDQGLPPDLDPDDLSINLMLTKSRLRPDWLREFMARPKDIVGIDTRMPTVFYTVDGIPKVEEPERDIEDITLYLMNMTEPPEETMAAFEAEREAEEEKENIDWTTYQY